MKLEKVTAEIRPRGRWESIDLGCALVRENYGKVMAAWFATVVPLWCVIIAVCQLWPFPEGRPWLAGLCCVWVLPICGRVPLYVLSRRLFGEDCHWTELVKAFPRMIFRRFFTTLLIGPLNPSRCLSQPVSELEGLKGKAYRARVQLLARNGGEGATQAALISVVLVLATMFSLFFIYLSVLGMFGDSVAIENFWVEHVLESEASFLPVPYVWIGVGLMLAAITLIEPFYVGAGFSMYVNSRTITEGWDIELAFKRMSARIDSLGKQVGRSILVAACGFGLMGANPVEAQESNERLAEVLAHEDFEIKTKIVEVPVELVNDSADYDFSDYDFSWLNLQWVGVLAETLFWGILAAVVVGVVWLVYSNRHVFTVTGRARKSPKVAKVSSVMGMDVTPESLPEDVVQAARHAWENGQAQLALSLLYRGAISWMVHEADLEIQESDTEQDCVQLVACSPAKVDAVYFGRLTNHWVSLAYGQVVLEESEMLNLCSSWPYRGAVSVEGSMQ